ncbi:MAG: polysaccharide pyruvyl transferase family protein, partial [Actinomycetota bacterium]
MEPNLSFCTMTVDPVATAARIAVLRPVVDEIVVAVDSRAADRVEALHEVDRCLAFDFAFPSSRNFAWLNAQCSGRWRLRLDADEVPGRALLDRLPELARADDVTHYWVPRCWLWGDADTWLTGAPWFPDFQLRLVRNLPAVDHPPRLAHDLAPVAGPGRYLDTPIYHLDLLEQPLADRAAKAADYERTHPGLRTEGNALNAGFYVPERRSQLTTAPVPEADRAALAAAAAPAIPHPAPASDREVIRVGRTEIDAYWPGRTLADTAYRARIEPFGPVPDLVADAHRNVYLLVTNTGDDTWPGGALSPEIRIGYRFTRADGMRHDVGGRALLPASLPPGASTVVPVPVRAPGSVGPWRLELDLVHEHVRWFDCPLLLDVTVAAATRVALIAGDSPFRHVGDDAIVRAHLQQLALFAPAAEPVLLARDPAVAATRFVVPTARGLHDTLYAGIDESGGPDAIAASVTARIAALTEAATRYAVGTEPSDPETARIFSTLAECRALVVATVGALTSDFAVAALWPLCATVLVATALGVPVLFSGVSVGPIAARDRDLVGAALATATVVVVRDPVTSVGELEHLGIDPDRIVVAPDPALAAVPAPADVVEAALEAAGVGAVPFAVVSLRDRPDPPEIGAIAALVAHLDGLGVPCLGVPHCADLSEDDRRPLTVVAAAAPALRILDPMPPDDVIAGMSARAALA